MRNHVFISYSRKDTFFAEYLEKILRKETSFEIWRDYKIEGGDDWAIEIDNALNESFALVVIVSPDSNKSPNVIYEWAFAMGNNRRVIPISFRPFNEDELIDMQYKLKKLQRLDLSEIDSSAWISLVELVKDGEALFHHRKNESSQNESQITETIIDLRVERSDLITLQKAYTVEGKDILNRIDVLEHSDAVLCPLCDQLLSDKHRTRILERLTEELEAKREEYRTITERVAEIAEEISILMAEL